MEEIKLTDKQEMFCKEYVRESNATKAAILAGYSKDTAGVIGCENLTKLNISARIKELRKEAAERYSISFERILQEYSRLAFYDIRGLYDTNGQLKNIKDIDYDNAAAITSLESDELTEYQEDLLVKIGKTRKVKLADKKAALDSLCKVLGFNAPEKSQISGEGGLPLFPPSVIIKMPEGMDINFPSNTDGQE